MLKKNPNTEGEIMLTTRFEPASRKNVDRTRDPYIPRKGPLDVGVCPECHAISRKKRWYLDEAEYVSLARTGAVLRRCPACRKIADGFPFRRGDPAREVPADPPRRDPHDRPQRGTPGPRDQSSRADHGHPGRERESVEILTTDEKLAQRIGREIRKAYHGIVSYKWSADANFLRVNWSRDT